MSPAWIAIITALIESGLAEKLVDLLIQIFNSLSADLQKEVAKAASEKFIAWGKPTIPTA